MTDTVARKSLARTVRPHGVAAIAGGVVLAVLGVSTALSPTLLGPVWFAVAALTALLFTVGILGMRCVADTGGGSRLVRPALGGSAAAMALFAAAHLYALADEDTAIVLFSVLMILAAAGLATAGITMLRARTLRPQHRVATLLAGVWPVATIPAGAALGDIPHFLAIAMWGVCWVVFGSALLTRSS